jgi:hypothetical protein
MIFHRLKRMSATGCESSSLPERVPVCSGAAIVKRNDHAETGVRVRSAATVHDCATFVAMVQTTHLWEGDDGACRGWLYGAGLWTILVEREMRPTLVMILKIGRQYTAQVTFIEDDDVIDSAIQSSITHGNPQIILDMSELTFISSVGLRLFREQDARNRSRCGASADAAGTAGTADPDPGRLQNDSPHPLTDTVWSKYWSGASPAAHAISRW